MKNIEVKFQEIDDMERCFSSSARVRCYGMTEAA